jgi:hypothetical protein
LRVAERSQYDPVDDRENGGVGPDSERQRQNRDDGERRRAQQAPHRVAEVLAKVVEAHGSFDGQGRHKVEV